MLYTPALPSGYFVGTINRVGIEPLGEDDFYGQSYFCDPRGQFIGEMGDAHKEELMVRDMDLDKIQEVRNTWQFFRRRRLAGRKWAMRPSKGPDQRPGVDCGSNAAQNRSPMACVRSQRPRRAARQ